MGVNSIMERQMPTGMLETTRRFGRFSHGPE